MRVLCLTFGDATTASTFYRIHQYVAPLASRGIHLEPIPARQFNDWEHIPNYDVVLLQKALLPSGKLIKLRRLSRRLLYDVDDAVWHPHGKKHFFLTNLRKHLRLRTIARAADLCIAANNVLAAYLRSFTKNVVTLPMALNELEWKSRDFAVVGEELRIGWSGHPVNLRYLLAIEEPLVKIQAQFPHTEVVVFSGDMPCFQSLKAVHLPFVQGTEPEVLRTFDIGLLPLPDDPFSQGKSPIKGLQYLACGTTVVASPVGATKEILQQDRTALFAVSLDEWVLRLRELIENPAKLREISLAARRCFEEQFTLTRVAPRLAAILSAASLTAQNEDLLSH
ncbi:MAG: glycosyltransferase [Verrucomicrobia subdivision 3 bacterium]|nr:glycosyltransferase [Limisphaerales bacterium]